MHLDRKHVVKVVLRDSIVILIGVPVVLAAVILYAEIGSFPWMPSVRWWGLAVITGLLLWMVVSQYRRHWRRRSFWLTITMLTALHLAAWGVLLASVAEWGLLWFVPPVMVEGGLFVVVLDKLGYDLSA